MQRMEQHETLQKKHEGREDKIVITNTQTGDNMHMVTTFLQFHLIFHHLMAKFGSLVT